MAPFAPDVAGYAAMVGHVGKRWRHSRLYRLLSLDGWVAFDVPRTVTAVGVSLLGGIAAVHVYLLSTEPVAPPYFVIYCTAVIAGCLITVGATVFGLRPRVAHGGWYFGSLMCVAVVGSYLVSRLVALPGLPALTGRWDVAPATLATALAVGFIAVHTTVLTGINVAYPQRQHWLD